MFACWCESPRREIGEEESGSSNRTAVVTNASVERSWVSVDELAFDRLLLRV